MTEIRSSDPPNRSPSAENLASSSPRKSPQPSEEHTQETDQQQRPDKKEEEKQDKPEESSQSPEASPSDPSNPPLPDEVPPPLPNEAPPDQEDDGWEPVWDAHSQAYYFYNRFTGISQWENPRVPDAAAESSTEPAAPKPKPKPVEGGYNPAIHGDYDPTAPYAQHYEQEEDTTGAPGTGPGAGDPTASYTAAGQFNRFTGRWQAMDVTPENYNDENKARRQMNAFFDVDAAANSHNGRSLRAERSAKKLSRNELKMFKEKRREKKEEKRRAWLRD